MSYQIVAFHEGLLPAAAELLAGRHRRDRAAMPLLAARFEEARPALAAAREVWHKPQTSGAAALRDGRLIGYLLGEAKFDTLRGRHVWVHLAGHALAADAPPDTASDRPAAASRPRLRASHSAAASTPQRSARAFSGSGRSRPTLAMRRSAS